MLIKITSWKRKHFSEISLYFSGKFFLSFLNRTTEWLYIQLIFCYFFSSFKLHESLTKTREKNKFSKQKTEKIWPILINSGQLIWINSRQNWKTNKQTKKNPTGKNNCASRNKKRKRKTKCILNKHPKFRISESFYKTNSHREREWVLNQSMVCMVWM